MSNEEAFANIYLACALTNVSEPHRRTLQKDCAAVVDSIIMVANENSWKMLPYDPIRKTSPWQFGEFQASPETSEEIWFIDTSQVLEQADAIIIHGFQGGSTGVGVELALALVRGIPILYLHHETCEVSRMVKGIPGKISIRSFMDFGEDDRDNLREVVRTWIVENHAGILNGPVNRQSNADLFSATQSVLLKKWERLNDRSQLDAAHVSRMTVREVTEVLSSPMRTGSMSVTKLLLLGTSLRESVPHLLAPHLRPHPLSREEERALKSASVEYEWGGTFITVLENVARTFKHTSSERMHADPSRQAFNYNFEIMSEWARFKADWENGTLTT